MNLKNIPPTRPAARTLVAPGVELAYLVDDCTDGWKTVPTVMLLHGIGESAEAFDGWVPHLSRTCRVIRPDLRGYGRSSALAQDEVLTMSRLAQDIEMMVRNLGLEQVHVVGTKLGAQVILYLAQQQPPWLASMTLAGVLISPGGALGKWVQQWIDWVDQEGVEGWARHTMPGRMGTALSPEAMEWWTQYMGCAPADAVKACFRMLPSLAEPGRLEYIRCPTQVIVAVQPEQPDAMSQRQSVASVQAWQQRIPGSVLTELQADSYHIAATHPDACAQMALQFIQELIARKINADA